jgi:hypothetical protein
LFTDPRFDDGWHLDMVVAITAGNYADENQLIPPIRVIREVVRPSLS